MTDLDRFSMPAVAAGRFYALAHDLDAFADDALQRAETLQTDSIVHSFELGYALAYRNAAGWIREQIR